MKFQFFFSLILFQFLCTTTQAQSLILCFDERCEVLVNGESNVAPYQCGLFEKPANDTIQVFSYEKSGVFYLEDAKVKLRASSFKCDNKPMTHDFLESIKSDRFPYVSIEFKYFELRKPLLQLPLQKNIPVFFEVTLAGKTKAYKTIYDQVSLEDNFINISGKIDLKMSDFGITPPEALFGAIKVRNEIQMVFHVRFCLSN